MMYYKIDLAFAGMLLVFTGVNFLSCLVSIVAIIYYLSMLKINVVDKKYKGNWGYYIFKIFKK